MDRSSIYYKQVQLLIQVLPFVAKQECFALKGGAAINLFVRESPRLSVDIDLVYLPIKGRDEALQEIREALDAISEDLKTAFKDVELTDAYKSKRDSLRLVVARNGVQIKVELSPVLRGTVYEPQLIQVCAAVEDEFGYVEMPVVAVREHLVEFIHQGLTDNEKDFLLSFKSREPDCALLDLEGVSELPAIKWKQINLAKMPEKKHKLALEKLTDILA